MYITTRYLSRFLLGIAMLAALISCGGGGGGGGSSDSSSGGTGTVGLFLTDMPADPSLFQSINASIRKVELLGSDGRVTLYSGPVKTYDLLRLRNESIPLTFKDGVPAGVYCKIRLTLSDLELVMVDKTPNDPNDPIETYHPKLPGNGKLDLLARDCFNVAAGEVVTLQLDIDAGRSIHIVGNNKGYNFRPVIFIDVMNKDFDSKLIRLNGKITAVDQLDQSLILCGAIPSETSNNLGCVKIHFGNDSAFFDNVQYDGAPRPIDALLSADKVGKPLTVVGWLKFAAEPDPAAMLHLDALVAELGNFLQVEGMVAVDADVDGFEMTVSPGAPIITSGNLAVLFQSGYTDSTGTVNGTRFVSKNGVILQATDVEKPLPVQVDGTLELISPADPMLKAALVIIDKGALNAEQVTGLVLSEHSDHLYLDPDEATVCGVTTDSLRVELLAGLEILTVTIDNSGSVIVPGGILAANQMVGMNGSCNGIIYKTDNVVIVDDQRP